MNTILNSILNTKKKKERKKESRMNEAVVIFNFFCYFFTLSFYHKNINRKYRKFGLCDYYFSFFTNRDRKESRKEKKNFFLRKKKKKTRDTEHIKLNFFNGQTFLSNKFLFRDLNNGNKRVITNFVYLFH
jgi:hypothetical protein